MKITSKSDRTIGRRKELGPQLPLEQPHVILLDPSSSCNLRCKFCPTGDPDLIRETKRFQGQMRINTFEKIVGDINKFKKPLSILRLYKEGEPLLNKDLGKFIKLAKESNIKRVDTTTNGIALTQRRAEELIESGIDQINISLNGLTKKQYTNYTQREISAEKLIEQILYLCEISGQTLIYVKCIKEHLSIEDQETFYSIFEGKADKVFLEGLQPNWPKFEFDYIAPSYETGHYGQEMTQREICPFIFYMMVINSDATCSACVQDWNHELIVGNANTDSISDIWHGKALKELRLLHTDGKRCCKSNCAECPVLLHGCLDNIDKYAPRLKEIFK